MKKTLTVLLILMSGTCFGFQEDDIAVPTDLTNIDFSSITNEDLDSMYILVRTAYRSNKIIEITQIIPPLLKIAVENDNSKMLIKFNNALSAVYISVNDLDAAEKIILTSVKEGQKPKNKHLLADIYLSTGDFFLNKKEYEKALYYNLLAHEEATSGMHPKNFIVAPYACMNISQAYLALKKYSDSQEYLDKAIAHVDSSALEEVITKLIKHVSNYFQGEIHLGQNNHTLAITYFKKHIASSEKADRPMFLEESYIGIMKAYEQNRNYEAINETRKKYESFLIKKHQKEKESQESVIASKYEKDKIAIQLEDSQLKNKIAIAGSLILIIFIVLLLFSINKIKKLLKIVQNKNTLYLKAKRRSEKLLVKNTKFLSTITHELRTPLYGIIGLTSLFIKDIKLKEHRKDLNALKFSVDYLLSLVNDVLLLNKNAFAQEQEKEDRLELELLVNNIIQNLEFLNKKNKNKIVKEIDPNIPTAYFTSKTKISQILFNLISNASKYTTDGLITVRLDLKEIINTKAHLAISVRDTGRGIKKSDLKIIFNEFERLEEKNLSGGLGLGLPIVKTLLEDFDSEIKAESTLGSGSTFSFDLWLPINSKDTKELKAEISIEKLRGKHFLVVDDNKINLLVTSRVLENFNVTCDTALDGLQAIEKTKNNSFDAILMDINMPIMNGFEASKKLRELGIDIPIIAHTAAAHHNEKSKLEKNGLNDIIVKPYKNEDLSSLLLQYVA